MDGLELKLMRIAAGLKQWEVAAALNRSGPWLQAFESGKARLTEDKASLITNTMVKLVRERSTIEA